MLQCKELVFLLFCCSWWMDIRLSRLLIELIIRSMFFLCSIVLYLIGTRERRSVLSRWGLGSKRRRVVLSEVKVVRKRLGGRCENIAELNWAKIRGRENHNALTILISSIWLCLNHRNQGWLLWIEVLKRLLKFDLLNQRILSRVLARVSVLNLGAAKLLRKGRPNSQVLYGTRVRILVEAVGV